MNAIRELLDCAMVETTSDAQTKRALAKYIAAVVDLGLQGRRGVN